MADGDALEAAERLAEVLERFLAGLLRWLYHRHYLRVRIVPLDKEGHPMTTAPPQPFPLLDDEFLPLGIALEGDNPNGLTIVSVAWAGNTVVSLEQTAPALTATAVATPGNEGTASVSAVVTLSDGSTLTTPAFEIAVTAAPVPLSAVIVPGTPGPATST